MKTLLLIAISSALINNVVLSQFMGLCPFLGVSKKIKTASGMGAAVIFVITISSLLAAVIYQYVLVPLNLTYLNTIVFILVIAALGLGRLISLPFSGPISDKFGRRLSGIIGVICYAIFFFGIAMSPGMKIAYAFAIVGGIANSFFI